MKNKNCIQVRYISGYCFYPGAGLVEVLQPNDDATASTHHRHTTYTMALLDLPEEFRVRDKVFFVKYDHDADLPEAEPRAWPLDIAPANLFVAKSVSLTGCDN
jgi:hypothetical protein